MTVCIEIYTHYNLILHYSDVQQTHYVTKFDIFFLTASTAHPKYDLTLQTWCNKTN